MEDEIRSATIEHALLLSGGWIFIILRTVARATCAGFKQFQLDDYLMPIAGVRSLFLMPDQPVLS